MSESLRLWIFGILLVVLLPLTIRVAAGRLTPKVAMAPLIYLLSRWPVLVAWVMGTGVWIAKLLPGAIERGRDSASDLLLLGGISALCGIGVAALVVGPIWMLLRAFVPKPVFELEPGERPLHEFLANHFLLDRNGLGGESRGGMLVVTSRRIGFRPNRFNVQLDGWSVRLEDIESLTMEGDRFLVVQHRGAAKGDWIVTWRAGELVDYLSKLASHPESDRAPDEEMGCVVRAA